MSQREKGSTQLGSSPPVTISGKVYIMSDEHLTHRSHKSYRFQVYTVEQIQTLNLSDTIPTGNHAGSDPCLELTLVFTGNSPRIV